MKKLVIVLAVIIFILLGILIFVQPAKSPTVPLNPSPVSLQPVISPDGKVSIFSPHPNDKVSSPLIVQGTVTGGGWFFEAVFPVEVLDGNGTVLGSGQAQAQSDWMATAAVPFTATITFTAPKFAAGTLILKKDNPSGLPQNDGELRIPVRFGARAAQASQCRATGCSKEVCSDQDVVTNCIFLPQYSCYKTARCERQASGECGWTTTPELRNCLRSK